MNKIHFISSIWFNFPICAYVLLLLDLNSCSGLCPHVSFGFMSRHLFQVYVSSSFSGIYPTVSFGLISYYLVWSSLCPIVLFGLISNHLVRIYILLSRLGLYPIVSLRFMSCYLIQAYVLLSPWYYCPAQTYVPSLFNLTFLFELMSYYLLNLLFYLVLCLIIFFNYFSV